MDRWAAGCGQPLPQMVVRVASRAMLFPFLLLVSYSVQCLCCVQLCVAAECGRYREWEHAEP